MSKYALIPAYNEGKNIKHIVERIIKLGLKPVVVDDGSKDNTYEVARKSGAVAVKHNVNKGKGEALKTGLNYLLKNYPDMTQLVIIDADLQYDPEEAIKIFNELSKKYDFVIGYRDWNHVPFRHKMGNLVWRTTFNILFGTKYKDTNCGLIGFNRRAIEKIKNHISGGYIIENSILIGALKNNLKVSQVPVNVNYHQKSKVGRGVRVVSGVLFYILKEGLRYRFRRKGIR